MKILHINTINTGGAAKACIRLHLGLLERGIDSNILFKLKIGETPQSSEIKKPKPTIKTRIKNKIFRILNEFGFYVKIKNDETLFNVAKFHPNGLEMISLPYSDCDIIQCEQYLEADLIHLHWVANFLDWETFFSKNKKPVVWTLHDQNPFLGYEHYDESFNGINQDGYPIIRSKSKEEVLNANFWLKFKENALCKTNNVNIVTPSLWLFDESIKSNLFKRFSHHHIHNGFPTSVFKPLDKKFSREILNIPVENKVLLFVADYINNQRKGFAYLLNALSQLDNIDNLTICSIGNPIGVDLPDGLINLGRVEDEKIMAMAYSAADLFIIPSLEDNLPNTMIESLLCGTPVIGFPKGGIKETIRDEINGFLTEDVSVISLVKTIKHALNCIESFNNLKIAEEARDKYSLQIQASKYKSLYNSILFNEV